MKPGIQGYLSCFFWKETNVTYRLTGYYPYCPALKMEWLISLTASNFAGYNYLSILVSFLRRLSSKLLVHLINMFIHITGGVYQWTPVCIAWCGKTLLQSGTHGVLLQILNSWVVFVDRYYGMHITISWIIHQTCYMRFCYLDIIWVVYCYQCQSFDWSFCSVYFEALRQVS